MNSNFLVRVAATAGVAIAMIATAGAAPITYNTSSSEFGGGGLILTSSSGQFATLTFQGNPDLVSGTPSNINLGTFTLECETCSSQADGIFALFGAFTFNLVVQNNGSGTFVGSSTGGLVYSDVSQISINWSPLQLGPGTNNADSGDFENTFFTTTGFSGIVAPNSGDNPGVTTVQGFVDTTGESTVPEPATVGLLGSALVGIGLVARRRKTSHR